MQMSFGTLKLLQRLKRDSVLMKIDALIEWEELRPKLTSLYKCELSHGGGQEPFDGLLMFKAILLGQWDAPFLLLPGFKRVFLKAGEWFHNCRNRHNLIPLLCPPAGAVSSGYGHRAHHCRPPQ